VIKTRNKTKCPVKAYAESVVSGKIVAGWLVRLACERHLRDLVEGPKRGLRFDSAAAQRALDFFGFLMLPEGDRYFALAPWQQFVVGSIFGWKGADGFRRFRTAYIESGKGSGKTPIAAGVGLIGLVDDGELAAEIYTAGVTRDQASYLLRDASRIAEASAGLRRRIQISAHNLAVLSSNSYMRAVSSEGRTLDQKRVHMALIDEIHEHPTSAVVDKMRAGTKAREQALIFEITNAGHDRTTVCWQHHEYSEKVLQNIMEDDSWFAYVCTLDACQKCRDEGKTQPTDGCRECDDWRDEAVWPKVNPSLGIGIPTRKYLREQVREAEGMPTKANIVKRLNFCVWTTTAQKCIPMDKWDAGRRDWDVSDLAGLIGRPCYAGLDIGATSDFTAFVLVFPHDDAENVEAPIDPEHPEAGTLTRVRRGYSVLPYFWLPERPAQHDARTMNAIDAWKRAGLVRTTPGDSVDYDQVLEDIQKILASYSVVKIAFDRGFQGSQTGTNLMKIYGDDIVVQFAQGILSMAAPFRELLELLKLGRLHHDGNEVLRWMASNTTAETRGGLTKPSKDQSPDKIDGITALTMALGVAITEPEFKTVYATVGELSL
jgi:phage terminase large subunit-like protein